MEFFVISLFVLNVLTLLLVISTRRRLNKTTAAILNSQVSIGRGLDQIDGKLNLYHDELRDRYPL